MPAAIPLLALALQAAASVPVPAAPAMVPAATPDVADERCLAAFAYLAGEPGRSAAAAQADRYGTLFFYGKLMGRNPGIDLGTALRGVVGDIAAAMPAEIARCRREVEAAGNAMAAGAAAARPVPPPPR